jgi:hypothetical protein
MPDKKILFNIKLGEQTYTEDDLKDATKFNELYDNIDMIHINSILFNNLKNNYIYFFTTFLKDIKKYLTIHDYQWFYPDNPNIISNDFKNMNPNIENIQSFELLISLCSKIIFPSNNIYNNYNKYIDLNKYNDNIYIVNHCDKIINYDFKIIPKINNNINISYIGYFINYKGSHLFEKIMEQYKDYKNYNINYHIFGNLNYNIKDIDNNKNIIIHNEYKDNNIINQLHTNNIHGILHLSLFDESYCYAITNSINSGIPILYINNGCINERLKEDNKYFSSNEDNIMSRFINFLDYIIDNNNTYNYYDLNNNTQPNRWYLTNYI